MSGDQTVFLRNSSDLASKNTSLSHSQGLFTRFFKNLGERFSRSTAKQNLERKNSDSDKKELVAHAVEPFAFEAIKSTPSRKWQEQHVPRLTLKLEIVLLLSNFRT